MSHFTSPRSSPPSTVFEVTPSRGASSPPSSPPDEGLDAPEEHETAPKKVVVDAETAAKWAELDSLLEKSGTYVKLLKEQMDLVRTSNSRPRQKPKSKAKPPKSSGRQHAKKRALVVSDSEEERESKRARGSEEQDGAGEKRADEEKRETHAFVQPALITGATLKDYQLEGVAWMAGLYGNGISGILADEMGLGKTIQTISFHAWLRERSAAPFMVVCPLSVLNNWAEEFARFAPDIPVFIYHGSPEHRAELRRKHFVLEDCDIEYQDTIRAHSAAALPPTPTPKASGSGRSRGRGRGRPRGRPAQTRTPKKKADGSDSEDASPAKGRGKVTPRVSRSGRVSVPTQRAQYLREAGSSEFENSMEIDEDVPRAGSSSSPKKKQRPLPPNQKTNFPVMITTYEMIIRDRKALSNFHWGFIVVDEGHRLKNIDCKLMREIKEIPAEARMVLTGTPLHNNLSELWALLNFVMPSIFSNLATFQEWFNDGKLQSQLSSEQQSKLIHSLHDILRPFLLRRLKADVEMDLPPKKEYVLYTPLSERQRELYDAVVNGHLRTHLIDGSKGKGRAEEADESEEEVALADAKKGRKKQVRAAKKRSKNYVDHSDEDEYFKGLEEGEVQARKEREEAAAEIGRQWHHKAQVRKVNNMRLQNTVMQLRKVCQHPFLFDWPIDRETNQPVLNEELRVASGKMMVLERLLDALFARGHKVLLFSQFTTMLDVIEDWATEFKSWPICRIDGSSGMEERRAEVARFQGGAEDAPRLFLLSTRAGGLGLNLVAADTVIFYDQDWNPQMDLQAQDRAHRIGQTRPVLIFRLICAHTVETKIMQRATEKRKLEALVIAKGEFKAPTAARNKRQALAEMAAELLRLEGEKIQVVPNTEAGRASVISDEDLDTLLDRRPEVFADRGKGWASSENVVEDADAKVVLPADGAKTKTAFAVYEAPVNAADNMLGMADDADADADADSE